MFLALLVNLICLEIAAPPAPVLVSVVKHQDGGIEWNDAQCDHCPCWQPSPGCALVSDCIGPCGYFDTEQWGPFTTSDDAGCVDMDLLPVPQDGWVYWIKENE
jgi:hypothetical protein